MASQSLAEDNSLTVQNGAAGRSDTYEDEFFLKRKVAILEELVSLDGEEPPSLEQRCHFLRQRVSALENEISKTGKAELAAQSLRNVPVFEFLQLSGIDYFRWLRQEQNQPFSTASRSTALARYGPEIQPAKRARTSGSESAPCLRCRTLKKKCDALEYCSHCPVQGFENEDDHWKVLGCFRGHVRDLLLIFSPAYARSTIRALKYKTGGTEILNFVLNKSKVSEQKRRRILYLVQTKDDFRQLASSSWDDTEERKALGLAAASLAQSNVDFDAAYNKIVLEDYEAAWSVLQAVSMDSAYRSKTAYNLFSLLRLGSSFSEAEPASWELFRYAKGLLRQSVELYLLERLCAQIASGDMVGQVPFDTTRATPNTLVLVDMKDHIGTFLHKFQAACTARAKLTGNTQLACFFALLVFGVAKCILIDTYSIRTEYEDPNPWSPEHAVKMTSAYKVLASIFCWASKTDIILQDVAQIENGEFREGVLKTRVMVRMETWERFRIKSTKDFLLGLGGCLLPDGSYNGFFTQKLGFSDLVKLTPKEAGME